MKSSSSVQKITFALLQSRLLDLVRGRIQNGEYTERGLARIVGISQPQIHNVLKGARRLNPDLADKMLLKLGLTALQLLKVTELEEGFFLTNEDRSLREPNGVLEPACMDKSELRRLRHLRKPTALAEKRRIDRKIV